MYLNICTGKLIYDDKSIIDNVNLWIMHDTDWQKRSKFQRLEQIFDSEYIFIMRNELKVGWVSVCCVYSTHKRQKKETKTGDEGNKINIFEINAQKNTQKYEDREKSSIDAKKTVEKETEFLHWFFPFGTMKMSWIEWTKDEKYQWKADQNYGSVYTQCIDHRIYGTIERTTQVNNDYYCCENSCCRHGCYCHRRYTTDVLYTWNYI